MVKLKNPKITLDDLKKHTRLIFDTGVQKAEGTIILVNDYGCFVTYPHKPNLKEFVSIESINEKNMTLE